MTTEVVRFEKAAELRAVAEPFLMRQEAHHNLLLGLIGNLETMPGLYGEAQPYLAAAVDEGEVAGVALMTPPRNLVLSLCEGDEVPALFARDALAFRRETAGVIGPVESTRPFAAAWTALTGERARVRLAERCYKLEAVSPLRPAPGAPRVAAEGDAVLLTDWWLAFTLEAVPQDGSSKEEVGRYVRQRLGVSPEDGGIVIWEDGGVPVSVAAYGSPTANSMRIGPVYTPPEKRRKGYAGACTAEASRRVLAAGKQFVTLFTDLSNSTSNHIYQEIGFRPVCDVEDCVFERG